MATVESYLLSVRLSGGFHGHMYLITNDRRLVESAPNRLLDLMEAEGLRLDLPVVLATCLGDCDNEVREVIREASPEAWDFIRKADTFHCSVFTTPVDCPWDRTLMALH